MLSVQQLHDLNNAQVLLQLRAKIADNHYQHRYDQLFLLKYKLTLIPLAQN